MMSDIEIRAGLLLALAIPASAGTLVVASSRRWLRRVSGQLAAAGVIYALLLVALGPAVMAVSGRHQGAAVAVLVAFDHCAKQLFEVFKYLGVQDIAWNQPKSLPYPTENPWA